MCIAVECFHKASLIHDDIEDGDELRYGQKTLHAQMGIPIAINIGDYLIGLGYQILSDLDIEPTVRNRMISIAAAGHRILCTGQGAELDWCQKKNALSMQDVLIIFEQKTVPAFDVALKLGAVAAGADVQLLAALERFSRFVGLAYQISDDLLDWQAGDKQAARLSMFRALPDDKSSEQMLRTLLSDFHSQARNSLEEILIPNVKGFLRKVLTKILDQMEEMTCCEDHTPRND
jgi:geranylgeranyl pyrophosphate synthase